MECKAIVLADSIQDINQNGVNTSHIVGPKGSLVVPFVPTLLSFAISVIFQGKPDSQKQIDIIGFQDNEVDAILNISLTIPEETLKAIPENVPDFVINGVINNGKIINNHPLRIKVSEGGNLLMETAYDIVVIN